jgi:hypothetical protein
MDKNIKRDLLKNILNIKEIEIGDSIIREVKNFLYKAKEKDNCLCECKLKAYDDIFCVLFNMIESKTLAERKEYLRRTGKFTDTPIINKE